MASEPYISVIMPVYNEGEYLAEALQSFLGQSIAERCELICVDDGSTDDSVGMLNQAAKDHPHHITVIHQNNRGSGPARNAAMAQAHGQFIGFLDADDLYPSNTALATLYSAARTHQASVVGGSLEMLENGIIYDDFSGRYGFTGHTFANDEVLVYREFQFDYGYQRFIYRRRFLEEHGLTFPHLTRFQDPPFFVLTMLAAKRFYALTQATYRYRSGAKNISWDRRKALDLLEGAGIVAATAIDNGLYDLLRLTISRLEVDFAAALRDVIVDQQEMEVLRRYLALYEELRQRSGSEQIVQIIPDTPAILVGLSEACRYPARYKELETKFAACSEELAQKQIELDNIYQSASFKLARVLMTPFRVLRYWGS
jgi:glycosyltransferase involved in cell wall biosynthesis